MSREHHHVWVVQRDRGTLLIALASEEAAGIFRKRGWRVTQLPSSAFTEPELRCLGIEVSREG